MNNNCVTNHSVAFTGSGVKNKKQKKQNNKKKRPDNKQNKSVSDIIARIIFTCHKAYFLFQLLFVIVFVQAKLKFVTV